MKIYRHGDLLIRETDKIPTKAKKVSSGKFGGFKSSNLAERNI